MPKRGAVSFVCSRLDVVWFDYYGHFNWNNRHGINRIRVRRTLHIPLWYKGKFDQIS